MEKEISNVVEWKIRNISCWSMAVHGKKIKSPFCSIFESEIKLYPRGTSGEDEYLAIRIKSALQGTLSFFSSDGSNTWTTEISLENRYEKEAFEPLAKFDDVVPRRNEPPYEDHVVLRFRLDSVESKVHSPPEGNLFAMCTTIDVFTVSFTIIPKLIKDTIAVIKYSFKSYGEEDKVLMCLKKGVTLHDGKTKLQLEPFMTLGAFSVRSCIDLQDRDGNRVSHEENDHLFLSTKPWTVSNSLKLEDLAKRDFTILLRLKIVYDHTMEEPRIFCLTAGVRRLASENNSEGKSSKSKDYENSIDVLAKDFLHLYQNQDFSDLLLSCGNASFATHRSVLSARSPVFKKILSSDSKMIDNDSLLKVDMDPPTLSRFLMFLYSGSAPEDLQWESAIMLYNAAQKYQVHTLKKECVSVLCANVSVSNVCEILLCADEHKDYQITSAAHEFIVTNFSEVLGSEKWQRYTITHAPLLLKTVNQLAGEGLFTKKMPQ